MANSSSPLSESPLDLDQAGRDELIDGAAAPVVTQPDLKPARLEPPRSRRTDAARREVDEQSAILSSSDLKKLSEQKPR